MARKRRFKVTINGRSYEVEVEEILEVAKPRKVELTPRMEVKPLAPTSPQPQVPFKVVPSPLPGKVVAINVKVGDSVRKGDRLLVIDSMKMENEILSPRDGVITDVKVSVGATVNSGDPLIILD